MQTLIALAFNGAALVCILMYLTKTPLIRRSHWCFSHVVAVAGPRGQSSPSDRFSRASGPAGSEQPLPMLEFKRAQLALTGFPTYT